MNDQTIVVADDDAVYLAMIRDLLSDEGYRRVLCVANGDAEATIRRERPGLVLLDIHVGSDGWGLVSQMRRDPLTSDIPILICTTNPRLVENHAAYLLDATCTMLAKPFDLEDLLASVRARVGPPAR